jgi:hypothetical protein
VLQTWSRCCRSLLLITTSAIAACNTCFVGFSNNGNGGVIIKSANPPPACSLPQPVGKMSVTARRGACVSCVANLDTDHVFLTIQSIRLRPSAPLDENSADWIELAPALRKDPHQFDLAGDFSPETLVKGALVPADSYVELRIKLFSENEGDPLQLPSENACGEGPWNCIMTGDKRIEPLYGPSNSPEVVISLEAMDGSALVVLPNSSLELQVSLARQNTIASSVGGVRVMNILAGSVETRRQAPVEVDGPDSN